MDKSIFWSGVFSLSISLIVICYFIREYDRLQAHHEEIKDIHEQAKEALERARRLEAELEEKVAAIRKRGQNEISLRH